jgi:hypothetical protein
MKTALLVFGIAAAMSAVAPPAQAQNYPWCARYGNGFGGTNCGFSTLAQCLATVQGIGGFCQQNDWYRPPAPAVRSRHPRAQY